MSTLWILLPFYPTCPLRRYTCLLIPKHTRRLGRCHLHLSISYIVSLFMNLPAAFVRVMLCAILGSTQSQRYSSPMITPFLPPKQPYSMIASD